MVCGLKLMPKFKQFALPRISLFRLEAMRREHGFAGAAFDTKNQITAAPIVGIICEGADGMNNFPGIPAPLELDALPLDRLAVK